MIGSLRLDWSEMPKKYKMRKAQTPPRMPQFHFVERLGGVDERYKA